MSTDRQMDFFFKCVIQWNIIRPEEGEEILPFVPTWMDLGDMLSEINHRTDTT